MLNRVIREEGRELLQYYPAAGYPPLREYLAGYLLRFGVEARPEEILIVNGSQQGFDLVARTLLDPGDFVAIEQPCYPRAIQVFRAFGAQLLPVPMAPAGSRGPSRAAAGAAVAEVPLLPAQRPQSRRATMPAAARQRLLESLRATGCRSSRTASTARCSTASGRRPAQGLDPPGRRLHRHVLEDPVPGLRLGCIVAAPELIERLEMAKELADIHTSPLIQAAVYHFCRAGCSNATRRARSEYDRRRAALLAALAGHAAGVTWTEPAAASRSW